MPAPLDVLFGGSPVVVRLYGDDGELDGTMPGDRIAGLTMRRGRQGATDAPAAGTFALAVVDGLAGVGGGDLDLARRCRVELDRTIIDAAFGAGVVDATATPRFTGQVTDLGDVAIDPTTQHTLTPVNGSSLMARTLSFKFDDGEVLATGTQFLNDQLQALLAIVWNGDPGVQVTPWSSTDGSTQWFVNVLPPPFGNGPPDFPSDGSPGQFNWWQPQATAGDWLKLWADTTRAEVIDRRDGALGFLIPSQRAALTTRAVDGSQVIAPLTATKRLSDVLNLIRVSWNGNMWPTEVPANEGTETRRSTTSIARYGKLDGDLSTIAGSAAAADDLGDKYLSAYSLPRWTISKLAVDLGKLFKRNGPALPGHGMTDRQTVAQLLAAEIGDRLLLTGDIPATSVVNGRSYFVTAIEETVTRTAWTITFTVVPTLFLDVDARWQDLAVTLTWNDFPDDLVWRFFGAWVPE